MTGLPDGRWRAWGLLLVALAGGCGSRPAPLPPGAAAGPAQRIVALAPSLTELAFAAGAGDRLVGVVEFSDHPDAARRLPRVGDAFRVDYEAIVGLRPDLILGWPTGNSPETLNRLRHMGYRVADLEPRTLDDIGRQIIAIGALAGTPAAQTAATEFAAELGRLRGRYRDAMRVRVFYQVAPEPLITVSARHFIGQAIETCGGVNVFANIDAPTPVVSREAVLAALPDVIVGSDYTAGSADHAAGDPLAAWREWHRLPVVAAGRLFIIDPDLMSVPSPRLLRGIELLCADLDVARTRVDTISRRVAK